MCDLDLLPFTSKFQDKKINMKYIDKKMKEIRVHMHTHTHIRAIRKKLKDFSCIKH